jgi:proteasome lid subunit RPN8/RPN11
MLTIPRPLLKQIHKHMEETYPHECCGLIIGTTGEKKAVELFRPCRNLNNERAADRYELDPRDMLVAQREFEEGPWDIIGIYHSHPDHPSKPSQFDTDRAWPGYSYIIGSVSNGSVEKLQSWELNESERKFYEEPLDIQEEE